MKPLGVLLVGIVAGWAASSVDWSREAAGQESLIGQTTTSRDSIVAVVAGRAKSKILSRPPAKVVVGRWRDRYEPDDAVIELLRDGTGTISNDEPNDTFRVDISWSVSSTFENACLVNLKYEQSKEDGAKPLPPEAKPFKMLAVFDGEDSFVFQRGPNDITTMDRQPTKAEAN